MIDIQKQIDYWRDQAVSDMETAEILIEKKKLLPGLFFCHLTIEKILKAHFVKNYNAVPPKTHNLSYLIEKSNLNVNDEQDKLLGDLMNYQLEGRYPEFSIQAPSQIESANYLKKTKELLNWLINLL